MVIIASYASLSVIHPSLQLIPLCVPLPQRSVGEEEGGAREGAEYAEGGCGGGAIGLVFIRIG